jgi:hypothetical protein
MITGSNICCGASDLLHYFTLLYFHYLDRPKTLPALDTIFTARCENYASAVSELMEASIKQSGCEAVDTIVEYVTSMSSSVSLQTLLFSDEDQLLVPQARQQLEVNFSKLLEPSNLWPTFHRVLCYV